MSEMIERVARAIRASEGGDYESLAATGRRRYRARARAAIEAMREPSAGMSVRGDITEELGYGPDAIYRAMIDAALNSPAKPDTAEA